MKSPLQHPQADQTHSATPSTSQPRQAQQASPDAAAIAHSPRMTAQRKAIRAAFGPNAAPAQLQGDAEQQLLDEVPAPTAATQRVAASEDAPNLTGMPSQLKSGIEALSGMDMSDVRVHRNSDKPAQLSALAYAQGNEIHLGPGQERHLGHEAWHVVQQRQGRVKATMQMAGVGVNDEAGLEKEADQMGELAAGRGASLGRSKPEWSPASPGAGVSPIQVKGSPNITESENVELSSQEAVAEAKDEDYVVIARVITPTQRLPRTTDIKPGLFVSLTKMLTRAEDSVSSSSAEVTKPEPDAVAAYVGQKLEDRVKELIEFTTDLKKISGFAKESNVAYTIYIRIQKKYLAKSESAEGGWMAKQSAPYEIVRSLKDDKHASVENAPMTNEELTQALNDELDAEFVQDILKRGMAEAFAAKPSDRAKYQKIMLKYIQAKKDE